MKKNHKIIASVIAIIALFAIGATLFKKQQAQKLGFLANENHKLFVPDHAPKMGAENPKVYLVEFLDPECESCRAFSPYVKELMRKYADQVQLVIRYAAFHKNSKYAISILEAARKQGLYFETLEVLFKSQPAWGNHHNPRPDLIWNFLTALDLDLDKIKQDMHDPAIKEIIEQDTKDGKTLSIRGTPSFFINGKPLEQFSYQQLELQIRQELEK